MRYRIIIVKRSDKDKYIDQFTIESNNIKQTTLNIKKCLSKEITERERLLSTWLYSKKKSFIKSLIDEIDPDLIDFNSKGNDISKEEFLENELYFAKYE